MRAGVYVLIVVGLLGIGRGCRAQDQTRPFIKLSHLGPEASPLVGAFICSRPSPLDEKIELVPGYRAEPVFVVSKKELNTLMGFARRYAQAAAPAPTCAPAYGTFELAFGDGSGPVTTFVVRPDDSLVLITELSAVVDGFRNANRKSPALWNTLKTLIS